MKKHYLFTLCTALFSVVLYSQVGVGTLVPEGALDVTSANNGILIPRVALTAINVSAPVVNPNGGGTPVDGTLVWNTATSGVSPNNVIPGFYFWQGTAWNQVGSTAASNQWALLGNSGTTAGTNFVGTTDAQDLRFKTAGADRFNIRNATGQFASYSLGNVNAPTYTWNSDLNTGMFSPGTAQIGFATSGTEKLRIPNAFQVYAMGLGSANAPFYSFNADNDTGIFSPLANNLSFSTAATNRMTIDAIGNVGVGIATPTASAKLDISATDKGILIPRVALTAKNAVAPVTGAVTSMLVYNTATAGATPNNVVPGFYYWNGSAWVALTGNGSNDWSTTGNAAMAGGTTATTGTNFIGTTDANYLNFRTNNNTVGRFSPLGEFFVGALNTVIAGDLMNAVGNATFPWAINGYTSQNGGGVYGSIQAGTAAWGGVQGEYYGTSANGNGVRGVFASNTGGGSFAGFASGVFGASEDYAGSYKFGVRGSGGLSVRSGGVFGYDFGIAMGALGYYSSAGIDYSVYGFGQAYANGGAGGRMANPSLSSNTNIGLGIYGGTMGGWVRGMKFGFHTKGETYSLYVDGSAYVNKPLTYLMENPDGGERIPAYMSTATRPEISANGKTVLNTGKAFIPFDKSFSDAITNVDDVVITATPQGKSNGIYIDQITKQGFWVIENNEGTSNVRIAWIAIATLGQQDVPSELLANDFDKKMDGVMFNENDPSQNAQPLWWDGAKIRWDKPETKKTKTSEPSKTARPKEAKTN